MKVYSITFFLALAFSLLFYEQGAGLNVGLLALATVITVFLFRKKTPFPWPYALAYLFTSFMVFVEPSAFQLFACIVALFLFCGKLIEARSSSYLSILLGITNMVGASLINLSERQKIAKKEKTKPSVKKSAYIKGGVFAAILFLFFGMLYQGANPVFESLIKSVDLSFVSIPWLFCSFVGYIFFLHFLRPYTPRVLVEADIAKPNELEVPDQPLTSSEHPRLVEEHTLGSIILAALNILLMFFLITDLIYLVSSDVLSNSDYSNSVHRGVYALMFSIVCAISIILYFFRGDLNFFVENQRLKKLAYLWIISNAVLASFTFYKNLTYVTALGLTYKRIGVFIYLLLVLVGLLTTLSKVAQQKNFVFLLRTNFAATLALLIMASAIPWDRAITLYNLSRVEKPDIGYLLKLRPSNSELLYGYGRTHKNDLTASQRANIATRTFEYRTTQRKKSWQSYNWYHLQNQK